MLEALDPDGDRILRARGGSSEAGHRTFFRIWYSPRTRR